MPPFVPSEGFLREELIALEEEGYDVAAIRARLEAVAGESEAHAARQAVYAALSQLSRRAGFDYEEPSDLAGIRALRPQGPRQLSAKLRSADLKDRTLGQKVPQCIED